MGQGFKKAGYATDPKYPDKLISIIERYQLEDFDTQVLDSKKSRRKSKNKPDNVSVKTYTVAKGDTLYSISGGLTFR